MTDEQPGGAPHVSQSPRAAAPAAPRTVRISRSRRHKVVGGVCGGLGRYFDLDPVVFRVPLAVLSVVGGVGLVAYGVAWLVLPFEDEDENEARRMLSGRVEGPGLTALLTVVVGFGLMLASSGSSTSFFSMMLLALLVGAAYWSQHRRLAAGSEGPQRVTPDPATAHVVASAPPEAQAPPSPAAPSWWRESGGSQRDTGARGYLWGPPGAATGPTISLDKPPGSPARPSGTGCRGHKRPGTGAGGPETDRDFWLGGLVLLTALLAALVVALAFWSREPLGTVLVYSSGAALAVFGLGLVLSAFWGRLGAGTIVLVVLTTGVLVGTSAMPDNIATQRADERWVPRSAAEVAERYEIGSGVGYLDLSAVELAGDETVSTEVVGGAGQLRVVVPHEVTVEVTGDLWLGVYHYEESPSTRGRPQVEGGGYQSEWAGTYGPPPGTEPVGRVRLQLGMGIGHMVVERAPAADHAEEGASEGDDPAGTDTAGAAAAHGTAAASWLLGTTHPVKEKDKKDKEEAAA